MTRGRNDLWGRNDQGETTRGKRLGGETTRGGNGLGRNDPDSCTGLRLDVKETFRVNSAPNHFGPGLLGPDDSAHFQSRTRPN